MIKLNHLNYYRLPWNFTDNVISWLEPTAKCNLSCEGCYRKNEIDSHKSLAQVREELEIFHRYRKCDSVSVAGGEPLLHPQIVDIVRMIKEFGSKPVINTNGIELTKELLRELKIAGVYGFTFHIDSKQNRPGWKDTNETQLNELRYDYAKMLADAKGIACSFNATVYEDTMKYIPDMINWAAKHIDIVNVMVFILYRAADNKNYDYYIGPDKIDVSKLVYDEYKAEREDIKTEEIIEIFRSVDPEFDACGYLNGSEEPDSFKWLLSGRLGTKKKIYGYMGRKAIELVQVFYHILFNKYLAYTKPSVSRKGKSLLLLSVFDKKLRKAFRNFYKNPFNIFRRLYYQSIMVIQPIDILEDGRQSMCDGCPDITVWNGKLVWSCRLEEQLNFGQNFKTYPKGFNKSVIEI